MAREYSRRSSRRGKSLSQQVLLIVVTYILGYGTASVFDVNALGDWMTTQVLENREAKPVVARAPSAKEQIPPKPKFEFYTLLANEKGLNANQGSEHNAHTATLQKPSSTTTPSSNTVVTAATQVSRVTVAKPLKAEAKPVQVVTAKPVATPSTARANHFVVQVASFKARQDAEHMKGLLILKGFEVNVTPVSTPQGNWFRVVIGPYPNRILAQKAQVILARTERLNGMVRSAS